MANPYFEHAFVLKYSFNSLKHSMLCLKSNFYFSKFADILALVRKNWKIIPLFRVSNSKNHSIREIY
jgi:hypothetical protein